MASGPRKIEDDDEEEEITFGSMLKKKPKPPGAGSSGGGGGGSSSSSNTAKFSSKNGVKKEPSFKIPRRDGGSPRPAPPGSYSSKSKPGSPSLSPRPGHSSSKHIGKGGGRGDGGDNDFERKPSIIKKRPSDFKRAEGREISHREDPSKAAQGKRKLEKEQRMREEARKKKRREGPGGGSGVGSASKARVKVEPGRSGSSSKSGKAASSRAPAPAKRFKETTRAEKIEQAMKVYKWWEEAAHEHGKQWESMEHNGAHFAPAYQPHGVKLKYDGQDVNLTPQQEEVATFYASVSWC